MNKKAIVIVVVVVVAYYVYWIVSELPPGRRLAPLLLFAVAFPILVCLRIKSSRWLQGKLFRSIGLNADKLHEKYKRIRYNSSFLYKHKSILKSITSMKIKGVYILSDSGTSCGTQNLSLIEDFKKYLSGRMVRLSLNTAISAYGSKVQQFTLQIHTEKGKFSYLAVVHPKNPDDIILMSPKQTDSGGIQLRGLKRWLDENIFPKVR